MIDDDGFRLNVGIVLTNDKGQLFWGRRVGQEAWQFPQGGIQTQEDAHAALYRELKEEVGLDAKDVALVAESQKWFSYRLPKRLVRNEVYPLCIGQKQKWFLLRLTSAEQKIQLDAFLKPEFDSWCWVNYWFPLHQVVAFKKEVYRQVLQEFAPFVMQCAPLTQRLDCLE